MAGSVNKVILIGNVGKDPEIRQTQAGGRIANLSVATTEKWKDKSGERKEKTEWHKVVVIGDQLAGVVESYVLKGSKLYIEGKLSTRKWTDKDGIDRYSTEIIASGVTMLDSRQQSDGQHSQAKANGYQPQEELDDEIPF